MLAKERRLGRIFNRSSGKSIVLPIDHGVTMGSIEGIANMGRELSLVSECGCNAVVLHKGMLLRYHEMISPDISLVLHLSAGTMRSHDPSYKVTVASVEEAAALGCDGVSFQMSIGSAYEPDMLREFGRVSDECRRWGMPLLAMTYVRDGDRNDASADAVSHAVRLSAEMGADIVKVSCPEPLSELAGIVACSPIPILIAGGDASSDPRELLRTISAVVAAGAAGTSIGRRVFQCERQKELLAVINHVVHDGMTADDAVALFDKLTGQLAS